MTVDMLFLQELADAAAAETLPRFRVPLDVANKDDRGFDPVTAADRAAEQVIRARIAERYPDHAILGEEYGGGESDSRHRWVIDPIDGTRAFISGLPVWATLIGLYQDGRARLGMMDQPFTGERFFAGPEGAFYRGRDGTRQLATRDCGGLGKAILFTTSPYLHAGANGARYNRLESAVTLARYGCDCYAFALLAGGHIDLVAESGLHPYDIAALIPIVERAGGVVTTWQGGRPEDGGDILAAATPSLHAEAMSLLAG